MPHVQVMAQSDFALQEFNFYVYVCVPALQEFSFMYVCLCIGVQVVDD